MTRQTYVNTRPRFLWLIALSAIGVSACAAGTSTGDGSGGSTGSGAGGSTTSHAGGTSGGSTGGTTGGSTGGTSGGSTGGTNGGGTGGKATGGTAGGLGGMTGGGTGGKATGGTAGGTGGAGGGSCANTNTGVINEDASGYVCNNTFGIKGAWYCYTDGSDTSAGNSCKGSDGKGAGAIPWNAAAGAMCLSGTMGAANPNNTPAKFAGIGFKVNSGPPGNTAAPGTYNASSLIGFAITVVSGPSGIGTNGMVLNAEYPTPTDMSPDLDSPGVTVPGVAGTSKTYNVLFADSVLANKAVSHPVDPANLTDVKIAFFPDSVSHTFDFCIKSVVPLMAAQNPVVATGAYGPTWSNQTGQAVNGVNGYAVQSAPFPTNGNPMTMQVNATASGVGFSYMAGNGFQAPNNGPGSFPAVISGWGPGEAGIQFYGPYKGNKKISQLMSVKSNWTFTMGSTGDAVYDVWFSNSAVQPPAKPGIELMIWIGNTGKSPLSDSGNPAGAAVTGSDGVARAPYFATTNGTGQMVVSYWVSAPGTTSVSNLDLLPYFKDAAGKYAGLTTDSVLLGIQTGFEVYSGNWTTTNYNINIQ